MKKTLTTLAICGFIVMNLIADSMDSRTITIGDTIVTAYRDGASGTNRNVFAIRHNDHIILINAGAGGEDGFFRHFIADGNTPENVTAVLLTNMHDDHIGGLLNGRATVSELEGGGYVCRMPGAIFRNATLYISKPEKKYRDAIRSFSEPRPLAMEMVEHLHWLNWHGKQRKATNKPSRNSSRKWGLKTINQNSPPTG